MPLGDGTGWSESDPGNSDIISDGAAEIRDLRIGLRLRLAKEHDTLTTSSAGGEHKEGSAKAYYDAATNPTLRPDGTTALGSDDAGRLAVVGGVLKYWDGNSWEVPSGGQVIASAHLYHDTAAGTSAGAFSSGSWTTRTLDQESDPNSIVSLSANVFSLGEGRYRIRASAPAYRVNGHQVRLFGGAAAIGSGTAVAYGTCEYSGSGGDYAQTRSELETIVTVPAAATYTYRLEHRCETTGTGSGNGLGRATPSSFGAVGIFAFVSIDKLSA